MKIGWQTGQYPAKPETWILHEIETLREMGHDVEVSAFNCKRDLSDRDFVICHFAHLAGFANQYGRPFVLVPHANDLWPSEGAHLKNALRYKHLRAVGCISSYHRDRYLEWGVSRELLVDWPCMVDTDLFLRKNRALGDLVIHGGRNVPKKGLELALEAWPDVVLFGDHPRGVGWLKPHQLRDLMENAGCYLGSFVVDAHAKDMDGLPIVVLEALSMGLPVVATKVAGLRDLEGLVIFAKPDPTDLCSAVAMQLSCGKFNVSGAEYVRERHSPKVVAFRILKMIKARR